MTEQEKQDIQARIDELKNKTNNSDEIYAKTKAEAETKEMAVIMQDPIKSLNTKLNLKVAEVIDNSQIVKQKIEQTTNKVVDSGLKAQENKVNATVTLSEDEMLLADLKKNSAEYINWGINDKVNKPWKRTMLEVGNDIWFLFIGIISFFTIVPISITLQRIAALKGFVKAIAIIVGIGLLLTCLVGATYFVLKWSGIIQ